MIKIKMPQKIDKTKTILYQGGQKGWRQWVKKDGYMAAVSSITYLWNLTAKQARLVAVPSAPLFLLLLQKSGLKGDTAT